VAVKKTTAKKSVAKKAAVKKSAPKKAASRATTTKKTTAKKTTVKKTTAKKASVKKSAVKKTAKKAVAKKAAVKRPAKKAVKRIASKKGVETIVIPEAPIAAQRSARVEIVSTPAPVSVASTQSTTPPHPPVSAEIRPVPQKPGASSRVIFAVVVGIILLGLIVWAKGNNSNSNAKPTPTPTATTSATPTDSASPTPSATETSANITAHEAPQGVVAHYTASGATIFWKAPTAVDGLTGYNVEISVSNGPWKLISTVPATQLSLDVKKVSTAGWTSFRVSSVYSDSQTVSAKAFGLPGTYS
jgi:DnaK suppressor protein